ncbi:hypothetical protein HDE_00506 [Halotydeus destructor]|nr:hypothetical protein HDE_00506 [Halotydeus destructor]
MSYPIFNIVRTEQVNIIRMAELPGFTTRVGTYFVKASSLAQPVTSFEEALEKVAYAPIRYRSQLTQLVPETSSFTNSLLDRTMPVTTASQLGPAISRDDLLINLGGPEANKYTVRTVHFDGSITAQAICDRLASTVNFINTACLQQNPMAKNAVDNILLALKTKNVTLRVSSNLIDVVIYIILQKEWTENMTSANIPRRSGYHKLFAEYASRVTTLFAAVNSLRSPLKSRLFETTPIDLASFNQHKDATYAFIASKYRNAKFDLDLPHDAMKSCFKFVQAVLFLENDNRKLRLILSNVIYLEVALFLLGTLYFGSAPNERTAKALTFITYFSGGAFNRYTENASELMRKARLVVQIESQDEASLLSFLDQQPSSLHGLVAEIKLLKYPPAPAVAAEAP